MNSDLLLIDGYFGFVSIAHLQHNKLVKVYFQLNEQQDKVGNVYLGRVTNVVQSLSAYFIDYGTGKNGFLSFSSCPRNISKDEVVIVQVAKNEKDSKGAKLTNIIKLNIDNSMLIADSLSSAEAKFKSMSNDNDTEKKLNILWKSIQNAAINKKVPGILYKESSLNKILRKMNKDIRILVDETLFQNMKNELKNYQVENYNDLVPLFYKYGIGKDIKNIGSRTVALKSGGVIVIDLAEAMVSIDVNSSSCLNGSLEETSLNVNLEAALEIAKQIHLRDLSGIIAIDFIDMHNLNHIYQVEEALRNALIGDHAALRISSINEFGVLFLSRQRSGFNIYEILYKKCTHCIGYGFLRTAHSLAFEILSEIRLSLHSHPHTKHINVECAAHIAEFILNDLRGALYNLEKNGQKITITTNNDIPNSFKITPAGEYVVVPPQAQPAEQVQAAKEDIILKVRYLEPDLPLYRHYISLDYGQCLVDFNQLI